MNVRTRQAGSFPVWRAGLALLIVCVLALAAPLASQAQSDAELDELGMTGKRSYESPQFGFSVEWSTAWGLDPDTGIGDAIASDAEAEPATDTLRLAMKDGGERAFINGFLTEGSWLDTKQSVTEENFDRYEEYPENESLKNAGVESVEMLLNEYDDEYGGALFLIIWDGGDYRITYDQIRVFDDYFVQSVISTDATTFLETYDAAIEGVEVDGEPMLTFLDANDIEDAVADVIAALDEDQGDTRTSNRDDQETDADDDTSDADEATYLADVRANLDELRTSQDRLVEIINAGSLSEAEADEANDILDLWLNAPTVAGRLDAPAAYEDLQQSNVDFAETLNDASDAFVAFVTAEPNSADATEAQDAFLTAMSAATTLGDELDGMLTDAGV